jgi:membrane-associated PAP2 superfamily phosphatase
LGFALGLGGVFGLAQQLRGAHFLSHDVWTLMICWLIALALYLPMLGRGGERFPIGATA